MKKVVLASGIITFALSLACANTIEIQGGETIFDPPYKNGSFIELLLRHPSGKRTGYDKKSARILAELSQACYAEQAFGEKSTTKTLVYEEPLNGNYILFVDANESGVYQVEVDIIIGEKYESKTISGLMASGDNQEIDIDYSAEHKTGTSIYKKVDIYLLKREMKLALKQGRLEKGLGKNMVQDLMHIDKELGNNNNAQARYTLKLLISKLANRLESFRINNRKDINKWFTSYFTENPNDMQEIIAKQDHFFLNIANINEEKKDEWFEARSVSILLDDAKILLDNIKI